MRTLLAAVLLSLAAVASAMGGPKKLPREVAAAGPDYLVSFSATNGALAESGRFIVSEGSQANYVAGGEQPWPAASGVEYKKTALVLNLVVRKGAGDALACELQWELSGPQPPQPDAKAPSPAASTAQLQTAFHAKPGKPVVLLDQGGRRLEVTIQPAP